MNISRTKEMMKMKEGGATYQQIADACGITKQCAHYAVTNYSKRLTTGKRGRCLNVKNIKNEHIYEYFKAHPEESVSSFSEKIYGYKNPTSMRKFLYGLNEVHFSVSQIKRICDVIGKSFEEIFKE